MTDSKSDNCPTCSAKPGELHRPGCNVEQCPMCGRQLLGCEHFLVDVKKAPPDAERMPWAGQMPGAWQCREFGWYAKLNPQGQGYVPCQPDDPGAEPDLNRLAKEALWDPKQKRFARILDLVEPVEMLPDGTIALGHRRIQALKALGLKDLMVPVKPVSSESSSE